MWVGRTLDISPDMLAKIKRLNEDAHGDPFVEDWDHAIGGTHFFIEEDGEPVSHASVVERLLRADGHLLRTGYVEAVATRPDRQGSGLGTQILQAVTVHIRLLYELGALCTGENDFYARLGWETWKGPTSVRNEDVEMRTEDEDGNVMILRTIASPELNLEGPISCDWRTGDVW
jgi:aminoglycoside 2'-N-acetyltransferase I